jgi:DNA-binding transcriptional ArsR family regulator
MGHGAPQATNVHGLRALAHPVRLRLLSLLTGQAMSAAEAARELGCNHANASYHLRLLRDAGLLEVAEEVSVRGGRAVRYRYRSEHQEIEPYEPVDQLLTATSVGEELRRRTLLRDPDIPGHLTDAEVWVPLEAYEAFCRALWAASTALHAAARPTGSPGTVRMSASAVAFRMREA